MVDVAGASGAVSKVIDLIIRVAYHIVPSIRKWVESKRIENRIIINMDSIDIYIEAKDRGHVVFRFNITNFTKYAFDVDHVEIDFWRIGAISLPGKTEFIRVNGKLNHNSVSQISFSIISSTADITGLVRGIDVAQNTKSSPRASIDMRGVFVISNKKHRIKIPFTFNRFVNNINVQNAVAFSLDYLGSA